MFPPSRTRWCSFPLAVVLGLLGAALQLGCERTASPPPDGSTATAAAAAPRNILLIVVDTLRRDRLGCYGSDLGATPNLDTLAADSLRFEQAYAHAPWTLPSVASVLTSLAPPQHGAGGRLPEFRGLPATARTLAEHLRDAGYVTAAVVNVDFLGESFGLTQGFAHVDAEFYPSNVEMRPADQVTDAALAWLRRPRAADPPFFLFVHYFDPHLTYDPPAEYRADFALPPDRANDDWTFGTRRQITELQLTGRTVPPATLRRAEALYNAEVAFTDEQAGRLLAALDTLDLARDTVVAFTADHGEEFGDHGHFEHGHTLYNELVHVPLLIRAPGVAPATIASFVGHIDLAPTLCGLAGVAPAPAFAGRDRLAARTAAGAAAPAILLRGNFWGPPLHAWIHDGHKLIVTPGELELYDLRADPREQHNLAAAQPQRVRQMYDDWKLAYGIAERGGSIGAPVQLSEPQRQRLRALGYIE